MEIITLDSCRAGSSDEAILRKEFEIPSSAEVLNFRVHPEEYSIQREGLKIDIVFQLSSEDFQDYTDQIATVPQWTPLPIPEDFLRRMAAIESRQKGRATSYEMRGEPLPPEGSVYNPSAEQMLEKFTASLPPQPKSGIFQIRTAGNDIMHKPKSVYLEPDRDLNDFMLAMVDPERKQIIIKVSTSY